MSKIPESILKFYEQYKKDPDKFSKTQPYDLMRNYLWWLIIYGKNFPKDQQEQIKQFIVFLEHKVEQNKDLAYYYPEDQIKQLKPLPQKKGFGSYCWGVISTVVNSFKKISSTSEKKEKQLIFDSRLDPLEQQNHR